MNNCLAKCCAKGLQPLSYILVKTLIGYDGHYKVNRQYTEGRDFQCRRYRFTKGLDCLPDLETAIISIYGSKGELLGLIYWNNWNEGYERVSDYSIWFDEQWGEFGATAKSPFKSIDELCSDWNYRWEEL